MHQFYWQFADQTKHKHERHFYTAAESWYGWAVSTCARPIICRELSMLNGIFQHYCYYFLYSHTITAKYASCIGHRRFCLFEITRNSTMCMCMANGHFDFAANTVMYWVKHKSIKTTLFSDLIFGFCLMMLIHSLIETLHTFRMYWMQQCTHGVLLSPTAYNVHTMCVQNTHKQIQRTGLLSLIKMP